MNELLDKHAPFKKVSKYQLKLKSKPWITAAIHKSVLVKNSLFKRYIKLKDPVKNIETHDKYKFSTRVFPPGLKFAKVVPIHKKESKLKCSNYRSISLVSNLDKILEKRRNIK